MVEARGFLSCFPSGIHLSPGASELQIGGAKVPCFSCPSFFFVRIVPSSLSSCLLKPPLAAVLSGVLDLLGPRTLSSLGFFLLQVPRCLRCWRAGGVFILFLFFWGLVLFTCSAYLLLHLCVSPIS